MAEADTRDDRDSDSRYAGRQRLWFAEACDSVRQSPDPEKRNSRNCGRYESMMGMMRGRDTRMIDTVKAGGYALDMQDN